MPRLEESTDTKPMICTVMSGIIATMDTRPKASVITLPPRDCTAPIAKGSMNAAVSGPLATPPESKAGKCDYVLRNDGTLENFETAVNNLAEKIENSI